MRALRVLAIIGLALLASACASLRYYAHVTQGQAALLAQRRPVAAIVADENTAASLRARLQQALAARAFASDRLGLPRNRSYTSYVELGRSYATWNVFATTEFSVEPLTHCFPFAGCVAYRGYFDRADAERMAARLAAQGHDTAIEGAAAYSTLGWFADPILSSMLRWDDDALDGVIFHELAHQQIYVKDDTAFNESFASFVQAEGLREWRVARGLAPISGATQARDKAFTHLVLDLRERLAALYAQDVAADAMRAAKRAEIAAFRVRYARHRDGDWQGDPRHDAWVAAPINNARLVAFGLYDRWVPAFARLFQVLDSRWPALHACARTLARTPKSAREQRLTALAAGTPTELPSACHSAR